LAKLLVVLIAMLLMPVLVLVFKITFETIFNIYKRETKHTLPVAFNFVYQQLVFINDSSLKLYTWAIIKIISRYSSTVLLVSKYL